MQPAAPSSEGHRSGAGTGAGSRPAPATAGRRLHPHRGGRLSRPVHRRVSGRRGQRRLRIHGSEPADPGRTHGDRSRHRARSGPAADTPGRRGQPGLEQARVPAPRGFAVQLRINLEAMQADGSARPTGGTLSAYEPPGGHGIRVDGYGYSGYTTNPGFDSLLAKLIVHADADYPATLRRAYRALCEFRLEGVPSNLPFLQSLLQHPEVQANRVTTGFIDSHAAALLAAAGQPHPTLFATGGAAATALQTDRAAAPEGCRALSAPVQGVLVSLQVQPGDSVAAGQQIAVMEAMKMEFEVRADCAGVIRALQASPGDNLFEGAPLAF